MVNDTFGHQEGDLVLMQVGKIVASKTRQSDIACRYGGEEFMVVMSNIELPDVLDRAEYFRKTIGEIKLEYDGREISISAYIGIALYPLHGSNQDQILSCADAALYQAKNEGRNRVVLYSPEKN